MSLFFARKWPKARQEIAAQVHLEFNDRCQDRFEVLAFDRFMSQKIVANICHDSCFPSKTHNSQTCNLNRRTASPKCNTSVPPDRVPIIALFQPVSHSYSLPHSFSKAFSSLFLLLQFVFFHMDQNSISNHNSPSFVTLFSLLLVQFIAFNKLFLLFLYTSYITQFISRKLHISIFKENRIEYKKKKKKKKNR